MKTYIFDIDGVLALPNQPIESHFMRMFEHWMLKKDVYICTNNTYQNIMPRIGRRIIDNCQAVFTSAGNSIWRENKEHVVSTWRPSYELISYLESQAHNLYVFRKKRSLLRHIIRKESCIRGELDLMSGNISIDMFDDTFLSFQNSQHNFGRMEIGLQFDNKLLEKIEKNLQKGYYPINNSSETFNSDNLLRVNFFTISFNK